MTSLVKGLKQALSIVVVHLGECAFEMPEVIPLEGVTILKRAHNLTRL